MTEPVWLHWWARGDGGESGGLPALLEDFKIDSAALDGLDVLFGTYGSYGSYGGDAFVLLRRAGDGALLRVDASHCSCHGLEDQWEPEETSVAALRLALAGEAFGTEGESPFAAELTALLDAMAGDNED